MANIGWIKLHRKILDWEWSTKPLTFRLFIHILLNANINDSTFRGQFVPAGSFITGRIKLSQECGMTEREVRTALSHLKSTNEVTIQSTNEYSIISVVCWKDYQAIDQPNANERPTKDQRKTTDKETKNIRTKEEENIYGDFESFWSGWIPFEMNKGNKSKAEESYHKALHLTTEEDLIIKRDKYLFQCTKNKTKTKHVVTWLNQKGWEDDYEEKEPIKKPWSPF
jgi:hypothetical protein